MSHWSEHIDTSGYGQSTRRFAGMQVQPSVFFPSAAIALLVIIYTLLWPASSAALFNGLRQGVVQHFDGFMMLAGDALLVFCLLVAVSPLGRLRIGGKAAVPDYSLLGWFSMLFGAGMGVGLVFYGVAEPITHFTNALGAEAATAAPLGGAPGDIVRARDLAMAATLFDWSLHPWAMYAVVGLGLAIFCYDFQMPLSIRSAFYPLFGRAVWGRTGDAIDILAVFATLFGLATSLGLGAQQAMAGITWLYGVPNTPLYVVGLIALMAMVTYFSVAGGIDRGIKLLSEVNMFVALALVGFVFATGPTLQLLGHLFDNTANYVKWLPALSNPFGRTDTGFYDDWSVYYWAWWISWAPFVGLFLARISRGRTVREFMLGGLLAPSLLGILWLTVFGDAAIAQSLAGAAAAFAAAPIDTQLFVLLGQLPWAQVTSFVAVCLVLIFFITGWDSGTLVIDTLTAGGRTDTTLRQKVVWLLSLAGIGIALLLSGGLNSLQAGSVATGLPLAALLLLMCFGTLQGLLVLHRRT